MGFGLGLKERPSGGDDGPLSPLSSPLYPLFPPLSQDLAGQGRVGQGKLNRCFESLSSLADGDLHNTPRLIYIPIRIVTRRLTLEQGIGFCIGIAVLFP